MMKRSRSPRFSLWAERGDHWHLTKLKTDDHGVLHGVCDVILLMKRTAAG